MTLINRSSFEGTISSTFESSRDQLQNKNNLAIFLKKINIQPGTRLDQVSKQRLIAEVQGQINFLLSEQPSFRAGEEVSPIEIDGFKNTIKNTLNYQTYLHEDDIQEILKEAIDKNPDILVLQIAPSPRHRGRVSPTESPSTAVRNNYSLESALVSAHQYITELPGRIAHIPTLYAERVQEIYMQKGPSRRPPAAPTGHGPQRIAPLTPLNHRITRKIAETAKRTLTVASAHGRAGAQMFCEFAKTSEFKNMLIGAVVTWVLNRTFS